MKRYHVIGIALAAGMMIGAAVPAHASMFKSPSRELAQQTGMSAQDLAMIKKLIRQHKADVEAAGGCSNYSIGVTQMLVESNPSISDDQESAVQSYIYATCQDVQ